MMMVIIMMMIIRDDDDAEAADVAATAAAAAADDDYGHMIRRSRCKLGRLYCILEIHWLGVLRNFRVEIHVN